MDHLHYDTHILDSVIPDSVPRVKKKKQEHAVQTMNPIFTFYRGLRQQGKKLLPVTLLCFLFVTPAPTPVSEFADHPIFGAN